MQKTSRLAFALFALFLFPFFSNAQSIQSSFVQAGSALPNAALSLSQKATFGGQENTVFNSESDANLNFSFGYYNCFFGTDATIRSPSGSIGWGNNCTLIGHSSRAQPLSGDIMNATAVGYNARVAVNNGFVLGDTANVLVGIGTSHPNQRLTIRGNMNFLTASNLRFDNSPFLDINQNRLALGGEKGEFPVEITSSLRYRVASESQWADDVFQPSYKLKPLKEIESFIRQNGHLPGIPSAREVVQNGIDAAQMDAKLLSHIEQLALHAIEQKMENELLKNENQQLKENQQLLQTQLNKLLKRLEKLEANR